MNILTLKKLIVVALIEGILFFLSYIEYDNFKLSRIIYPLICISLPFVLQYLLSELYLKVSHIIISTLVYIGIISLSYLFSLFCAWSDDLLLYKNKKNKSLLIVCRTYDCYGTDEDCHLYKVKKITKHIKWVTKFEEKKVDSTKWNHVPFSTES